MSLQDQVLNYARASRQLETEDRNNQRNRYPIFRRSDRVEGTSIGLTEQGALRVEKNDQEYLTVPRGRTSLPAGRTVTMVLENGVIHSYW